MQVVYKSWGVSLELLAMSDKVMFRAELRATESVSFFTDYLAA